MPEQHRAYRVARSAPATHKQRDYATSLEVELGTETLGEASDRLKAARISATVRRQERGYQLRIDYLRAHSIETGCWVGNRRGETSQVRSITSDGYLRLEGRRGSFNPYMQVAVRPSSNPFPAEF